MAGIIITSIIAGAATARIGRYKWFPVFGIAILALGLLMFSFLGVDSPLWVAFIYMVIVGIGLGMSMQTLILGLQNGLELKDMGAGTSTATFFRSLGGSFGVAVLGTILNSGLASQIKNRLPEALAQLSPEQARAVAQKLGGGVSIAAPAVIAQLPTPVRNAIENSLIVALDPVFLIAAVVCAVGVVFALGMPDLKLRGGPAEVSRERVREPQKFEEDEEKVDIDNARAEAQTETLF
jgi:hypothetical protein